MSLPPPPPPPPIAPPVPITNLHHGGDTTDDIYEPIAEAEDEWKSGIRLSLMHLPAWYVNHSINISETNITALLQLT